MGNRPSSITMTTSLNEPTARQRFHTPRHERHRHGVNLDHPDGGVCEETSRSTARNGRSRRPFGGQCADDRASTRDPDAGSAGPHFGISRGRGAGAGQWDRVAAIVYRRSRRDRGARFSHEIDPAPYQATLDSALGTLARAEANATTDPPERRAIQATADRQKR